MPSYISKMPQKHLVNSDVERAMVVFNAFTKLKKTADGAADKNSVLMRFSFQG